MRRISIPLLLTAAAALSSGCRREARRASDDRRPVEVRVATVEESPAGARRAPGIVAARQTAEIAARSAATVIGVFIGEGDLVRTGQRLAELDSRDAVARIASAGAAERGARAEKERVNRLAEKQAATPREREIADSAAAAARAALDEARAALSYLRLAAPFAGRVTSVLIHAGDHVTPGEKLIVLESDAGFEAQATVEADSAARLSPGRKLAVRVDSIPEPLEAEVRSLSTAGDPETHRFLLRADLPRDPRLRSGIYASVELPDATAMPRRTVPAAAIVERGGLTGVFVMEGGKASLRWIATGLREGNRIDVRAGLAPGDVVVLSPGNLADGSPVTALNR
jgi:membrane fusion protein (multidrug efflux system)